MPPRHSQGIQELGNISLGLTVMKTFEISERNICWKHFIHSDPSSAPPFHVKMENKLDEIWLHSFCKLTYLNIAIEHPPCWGYVPGGMEFFHGYVTMPRVRDKPLKFILSW